MFHLITDAARKWPTHLAVVSGDKQLTYAELQSRSLRISSLLSAAGAGPGDRVGIHVHKSVDSMACVYGVLATGAAYVPLDPGASPSYAAKILAAAEAAVVLSDKPQALSDAASSNVTVVPTSSADDLGVPEALPAATAPDDLAYLMFTSGSTGQPKGIMHTHSSGLAYALKAAAAYQLSPQDRLANIAPLHFDQSTFELFSGPSAGATSYFIPEPYLKLPASLSKLIEDSQITVWYSVPFVLNQLLERGVLEERDLSSVRMVLFGGEVLGPSNLAKLMNFFPQAIFSNSYGPAEVNQVMIRNFTAPATGAELPIGQAWDGTEIQISEAGELLVRTDTMMAGYWQRPELTAECIVDGWYRTGDIVHRDESGEVVFDGRMDNQVKVRGQRVELEAVDTALSDHVQIAHGVCVLGHGSGGLPAVRALAVAADGIVPDASAVLEDIKAKLPAAAVPVHIEFVEALPQTGSGKIDRRAAGDLLKCLDGQ